MNSNETAFMNSKIKNKPAVIVINMLKDMILHGKPFPMPPEFKEQVIPRIAELLENARRMRIPVGKGNFGRCADEAGPR